MLLQRFYGFTRSSCGTTRPAPPNSRCESALHIAASTSSVASSVAAAAAPEAEIATAAFDARSQAIFPAPCIRQLQRATGLAVAPGHLAIGSRSSIAPGQISARKLSGQCPAIQLSHRKNDLNFPDRLSQLPLDHDQTTPLFVDASDCLCSCIQTGIVTLSRGLSTILFRSIEIVTVFKRRVMQTTFNATIQRVFPEIL